MAVVHYDLNRSAVPARLGHEAPIALFTKSREEDAAIELYEIRPEQLTVGDSMFNAANAADPRFEVDAFPIVPLLGFRDKVRERYVAESLWHDIPLGIAADMAAYSTDPRPGCSRYPPPVSAEGRSYSRFKSSSRWP